MINEEQKKIFMKLFAEFQSNPMRVTFGTKDGPDQIALIPVLKYVDVPNSLACAVIDIKISMREDPKDPNSDWIEYHDR